MLETPPIKIESEIDMFIYCLEYKVPAGTQNIYTVTKISSEIYIEEVILK